MKESNQFSDCKIEKMQDRKRLNKAQNIIYYILSIIEVLLAFRFIFKMFGANPTSLIVSFLYGLTGILLFPFTGIFKALVTGGDGTQMVFEPEIIIAAVVYALIARGIVKLVELFLLHETHERI